MIVASMQRWPIGRYASCTLAAEELNRPRRTPTTHHYPNITKPDLASNAYASTLEDVESATLTRTQRRLTINQAIAAPDKVGSIKLRFEEQKNGEDGEKKLFVRNQNKPHLCFVENFMQILVRHNKYQAT